MGSAAAGLTAALVTRYNENHDEAGRFTFSEGGITGSPAVSAIAGERTTPVPVGSPRTVTNVEADSDGDGVADAARVGVAAFSVPPPPSVPRVPNLTSRERAVESRFAQQYEENPQGMIDQYNAMRLASGEPNVFETDAVKMLDPGWNPPDGDPNSPTQETLDYRSQFNVPLHQTANAVCKAAFLQELDRIAQLPEDQRSVLVTAGGCGAGKSYALGKIDAVSAVKGQVAAVWDSAGDQNGTESPWVLEECAKRGIKAGFVYVHANPEEIWADPERGVAERALSKGRMIDAYVYADSYVMGSKNFAAFQERNQGKADFFVIDNSGKSGPKLVKDVPKIKSDRRRLVRFCQRELLRKQEKLRPSIIRGGMVGERYWKGEWAA